LTPRASAALPLGVYHNHANADNKIALTFDDGPHPRYTREILDILDEYHIPATFFFVGENVSYYSDTAREVAKRGHEIGNHTYSHPCASKQSEKALRDELSKCDDIIQSVTGVVPKLFRPPQGSWNQRVYDIARERDYSVILWDLDTLDWAKTPSDKIAKYILGLDVEYENISMTYFNPENKLELAKVVYSKELDELYYQNISELIEKIYNYNYQNFDRNKYIKNCKFCEFNLFCSNIKEKDVEFSQEIDFDTIDEFV
jgi:peptidoglycan/xylan/chitin deacetylase (PgdA/CDA1 family)